MSNTNVILNEAFYGLRQAASGIGFKRCSSDLCALVDEQHGEAHAVFSSPLHNAKDVNTRYSLVND